MRIRQNIERLRGERKLTAATVAERSGIPYPSSWYRKLDAPRLFRAGELQEIAGVLGVPVIELFR